MVKLTIDGKTIEVPEGTTLLRAAQSNDIQIPTLCDHPHLTPYGGCRLCLVEVEGARTLQPSCTLPVSPNMVVYTDNERIRAARKFVLTLIFSERNHFCPFCVVSGGDCDLQNAAYQQEMTHWPLQPNWQTYEVDASHPYFVLDHSRCILCRRCVRACGELVGNFTLGFEERGAKSILIADLGTPLGESSCISCGSCVQVCPTGALIDRWSAYRGRDTQVERTNSICVGCSVGCGIDVLTRDNLLVRIESNWDAPVNNGVICKVGRFEPLDDKRERIITPLVRKDGALKAATWEDALGLIASRLKPLAGKKGDGVAALVSTRLPAETLYTFKNLFADQLGSDMVTSIEEGQPTALPAALADELGKPFEGKLENLKTADCIVTVGVDLVENHEVAGFFVKRSLPAGVKLVVIDPEPNALDDLADVALKTKKGSDTDLLEGLSAALVKLGLAKGKTALQADALKAALEKTGVSEEMLMKAARLIGAAENPVFVYGKGISAKNPVQALKALVELNRLSGSASGPLNTKGQANSMAASQYHLDKPFQVNGHQAVYVALGDDHPSQRLIQRLEKAPFTVVQASYTSQLTAMADVVLPVEIWAEQEGHYLNLEGRLQKANRSLGAPEDVKSSEAALIALAERLGVKLGGDWKKQLLKERVPTAAIIEA